MNGWKVLIRAVAVSVLGASIGLASSAEHGQSDANTRDAALRARVNGLYRAWSARDWGKVFKYLPPDEQSCGRVQDIREELGGESGQWPVSWKIEQVTVHSSASHRLLNVECKGTSFKIDAVARVTISSVFEGPTGKRESHEHDDNAWLWVSGQWYWSPSEE